MQAFGVLADIDAMSHRRSASQAPSRGCVGDDPAPPTSRRHYADLENLGAGGLGLASNRCSRAALMDVDIDCGRRKSPPRRPGGAVPAGAPSGVGDYYAVARSRAETRTRENLEAARTAWAPPTSRDGVPEWSKLTLPGSMQRAGRADRLAAARLSAAGTAGARLTADIASGRHGSLGVPLPVRRMLSALLPNDGEPRVVDAQFVGRVRGMCRGQAFVGRRPQDARARRYQLPRAARQAPPRRPQVAFVEEEEFAAPLQEEEESEEEESQPAVSRAPTYTLLGTGSMGPMSSAGPAKGKEPQDPLVDKQALLAEMRATSEALRTEADRLERAVAELLGSGKGV